MLVSRKERPLDVTQTATMFPIAGMNMMASGAPLVLPQINPAVLAAMGSTLQSMVRACTGAGARLQSTDNRRPLAP